jgi:HYR domain
VVTYPAPTVSDPDDTTAPTATCTPPSGFTFPIGTTAVTCTVSDPDDSNSPVTASFTVTVSGAAGQLADLNQAVQKVGPGTSLADSVAAAQSDLASGDTADTCGALTGFIHEVEAQSGKHIPAANAATLISDAQRIQTVLGC